MTQGECRLKASSIFIAVLLSLSHLYPVTALGQDQFSQTELQKISPVSTKSTDGEKACASFEATFDSAIKGNPTAILDVEENYGINGIVSKLLKAIIVSAKKLRLVVTDEETCKALQTSGKKVSVTIQDGEGTDGLPLFPESKEFKTQSISTAKKSKQTTQP